MGNRKISSFLQKDVDESTRRKFGVFLCSCLLFFVNLVFLLFGFLFGHLFRNKNRDVFHVDDSIESRELKEFEKFDWKGEVFMDEKVEKRMPAFSFKYQSKNFDEKMERIEEDEQIDEIGSGEILDMEDNDVEIRNYRFFSEKNFSGFVEEAKTMSFNVNESFTDFEEENFHRENVELRFLCTEDFLKPSMDFKFEEESNIDDYNNLDLGHEEGKSEDFVDFKNLIFEKGKPNSLSSETDSIEEREIRFIYEDFSGFEFESDTESSIDGYSVKELNYDFDSDGLFSERDFGDQKFDSENRGNLLNSIIKLQEVQHESLFLKRSDFDDDNDDDRHDHEAIEENIIAENFSPHVIPEKFLAKNELIENENSSMKNVKSSDSSSPVANSLQIEFIEDSSDEELSSVKNGSARLDSFGEFHFVKDVDDLEQKEELFDREGVENTKDDKSNYDLIKSKKVLEETKLKCNELEIPKKKIEESKSLYFDSENLDELWEHQDLIEQLKMEIKKVRAVGLPTILEESESPKAIEDFGAFRIDEKFLREDPMDELQKFYKSYRERMRKFDILNYQKMYAMGFLQMKNPLHSKGTQKQLLSTIMTHFSHNILHFCQKKYENDPTEKLFKDLKCDLETVYVGQTCLSWEFLRWQYEKSRDLQSESVLRRNHNQYNQAADEFQKFQVLVQRFTENEPFHGPRLPNYVKQRCVLRNLLQVPIMKEDSLKDGVEKKEIDIVITFEMLEDIMEETIRVFWEFVKAEKHETPLLIRVLSDNNAEVQDPSDYEFMEEIQANLHKKDKKLKDLLRTGNCLVKKFKKPQEDRSNQDLFFSQVDLKLVSRVLKMPRITGAQLMWCHKKLSKITFSERKVQREPSFLLFPC